MQRWFLIYGTAMASFLCISVTKNVALASLNPNDHSHSPPLKTNGAAETIPISNPRLRRRLPKPRRPSVIEIERAIGGGRFRDADPRQVSRVPFVSQYLLFSFLWCVMQHFDSQGFGRR